VNQKDEDQALQKQAEELLARPCGPDDAARAHLTLGCVHEHEADWEAAIASYRQVLANDPQDPTVKYYGNNNLGFSLIQLGRFDEAEDYCLAAIEVDVHRHNAHKNLGLVHQGQGRWLDAALSFLTAYELNPRDPRAWHHLEQVLAARPVLLKQSESLRAGVEAMQKAIVDGDCSVMQ
jgi:tetratricopeptide (TPR) repeat protein